MAQELEAAVELIDDKVRFQGAAGNNPSVTFDYEPPLGEGQGYTGLQGLLLSLAACSGTAVVALLRQMRKTVGGLRVTGRGTRRDEHPTSFATIDLHFAVVSPDATEADVRKAIQLSEESICPVWNQVKGSAEIRADCSVSTGAEGG